MSNVDWQQVSEALNQYLFDQRLSAEQLSSDMGIARKTLDRIRGGAKGNSTTLRKIEARLGRKFPSLGPSFVQSKHDTLNITPYSFEEASGYIGTYYAFRSSFDYPDRVVCAHAHVYWDDDRDVLRFKERQRNKDRAGEIHEYTFEGVICIHKTIGILQLLVEGPGVKRVANLRSVGPTGIAVMKGVLLAINEMKDVGGFYPIATPIIYFKDHGEHDERDIARKIGAFERAALWHTKAAKELDRLCEVYLAPVKERKGA